MQGSAEVLADTLTKLSDEKVKIRIIRSGVGAINESDVLLASASNAIIIGFNVRPDRNAQETAEREEIDIRLHSVIYNVTDEIKKAMEGLLDPTFKEVRIGTAAVREVFKVPKIGAIAGCMVTDGRITRAGETQARLLRDNVVVFEGKIASLRRFKDDVSEVKTGLRVRYRAAELQRHQGRRRHRGLHDGAGGGHRIERRNACRRSSRRDPYSLRAVAQGQAHGAPADQRPPAEVQRRRRGTRASGSVAACEPRHRRHLEHYAACGTGTRRCRRRNRTPRAGVDDPVRGRVPDVMAQGHRPDRVGDQIREELSDLLSRGVVHDPGIGFITLTRVKMSPDLQLARVFYTCWATSRRASDTAKALERATPFLRRHIGSRLRLRRVPELDFRFDESVAHQDRIEQILRDLREEEAQRAAKRDGEDDRRTPTGMTTTTR